MVQRWKPSVCQWFRAPCQRPGSGMILGDQVPIRATADDGKGQVIGYPKLYRYAYLFGPAPSRSALKSPYHQHGAMWYIYMRLIRCLRACLGSSLGHHVITSVMVPSLGRPLTPTVLQPTIPRITNHSPAYSEVLPGQGGVFPPVIY